VVYLLILKNELGKMLNYTKKYNKKIVFFSLIGFIVNPVIKENQFTNPPISPKTAPILKT